MMMSQTAAATLNTIYSTADNLMMNVSPSTTAATTQSQQQPLSPNLNNTANNTVVNAGMSSSSNSLVSSSTSPYHHQLHNMSSNNNNNTMVDPSVSSSSQQQQLAHNNSISSSNQQQQHMMGNGGGSIGSSNIVGGMGTNTGNTQVLQELFRQQQHLQTQSMNYPQLNNSALHQHSSFSNNGLDPNSNNLNSHSTNNDYSNLILNMAMRGSAGNEANSPVDHQDFVMQQMLLQQQSQHMMQPHHHHYSTMPNAAALGLSQPVVHHSTANHHHLTQPNQMMHSSLQHHSMNSATLQQQVGLSNYTNGIQDNILNFLGNQQENDTNLVDQSNHDNLMMNNSTQLQLSQNNNDWRGDKVNFTYFDSVAPYVEHTQSTSVVDNSQHLHTNGTNLDDVVMRNNQNVMQHQHDQNQSTNGLMIHTYEQMNGNLYSRPMNQQQNQISTQQNIMGTPNMTKKTKLVNESPKLNTTEDPNREVTNCHCCGRSDAEVSFKKNYSIHEGNIESYRNTFPQNIDQITSGPVCATCYNKQWRFQRGLYDPSKIRRNNPREGIKQRSMRDGDSTGSPLTPTLAFPLNNRVSAIQTDYSPTNGSPRTHKRKALTVSTFSATTPVHSINNNNNNGANNSDHVPSDSSTDKYDRDSKRTKFSSEIETLCKRNKNPDEISIIVQFYQVDDDIASDSSKLLDQINEFNQTQLRIQKQQMFGIYPNEKDSEISKHFHQFYTTALKVNKKHFEVSQTNNIQIIQGKLALENIKQLLTDRAKDFKQSKLEDPKTSTSTSDASSLLSNDSTSACSSNSGETKVLSLKISSQDRFKNTILADVDEFFFVDKNLSEGDSIHVFLQ
ncbi:Hypothetical protein NAEGRDRAFT_58438 [Naegleria gruberi]|uniref:Uncharacterized protein n=1 Tax=Naegleria gruberi TaxID=5762 RepID=D2VJY8_NAEGR|nr:uncharacterized protein NAEGRDRAFT_58438 [Naegleria gruberi]EFC42851.1 Hypothetical protein NAEGRDRAFT_58438 [Naegleria gruberi]|eukprot:XP_002675595.1 Hypothetical protein NAEGRDRAFT_58438 [Naegleria gruberi strain NEG-M]